MLIFRGRTPKPISVMRATRCLERKVSFFVVFAAVLLGAQAAIAEDVRPLTLQEAEELAVYEALLFACVQFHHANIALPDRLDRLLRWAIVTPFMHKVHHSVKMAEANSNYGSLFTWWDRIFRTMRRVSASSTCPR